jgi:hypothetical protein
LDTLRVHRFSLEPNCVTIQGPIHVFSSRPHDMQNLVNHVKYLNFLSQATEPSLHPVEPRALFNLSAAWREMYRYYSVDTLEQRPQRVRNGTLHPPFLKRTFLTIRDCCTRLFLRASSKLHYRLLIWRLRLSIQRVTMMNQI